MIAKKRTWILKIFGVLLGIGLASAPALASEGHGHCRMHAGGMQHCDMHHHNIPGSSLHLLHMLIHRSDNLHLSQKQQASLAKILTNAEMDVARQHAAVEVLAARFRSALHAGKVTEADTLSYAKKMGELQGNRLAIQLLANHKALALLNKKQRSGLWGSHHTDKKQ